jgi:hypothetical protein
MPKAKCDCGSEIDDGGIALIHGMAGHAFIDDDYHSFLDAKAQLGTMDGFEPKLMPAFLFDFQQTLVDLAVRKGRAALFCDCGLGKTPMQLVWAQNVVEHTNKPVLILTPLAVSAQTIAEGEKFNVEVKRSRDGQVTGKVVVTNYEQLHRFNANDFIGAVCDESSILKSFDGVRRSEITEFMRKLPYRLLTTATAAPNDYIELGTSSEALGYLGHMDMLNRFFKNDMNNSAMGRVHGNVIKWRFKGHAEESFWRWVCSWARACRKPSDLGFDDGKFILPNLVETEHVVTSETLPDGMLFHMPAMGLQEQRDERRRTITERCEQAAKLAMQHPTSVVWCHLNPEGDLLEHLIRDCVQVSGSDSDEEKEEKLAAFSKGQVSRLVTKSRIAGWGLNWQHCQHTVSFPSHSFEQYYQSVRRFWRFGQSKDVLSEIVTTEGEKGVLDNLRRKAVAADKMFESLVRNMNEQLHIDRTKQFTTRTEIPSWL